MSCAVFHLEDGRRCREMPRPCTTKTVVMAVRTVVIGMKTVFVVKKAAHRFLEDIQAHAHLLFATDDSPEV